MRALVLTLGLAACQPATTDDSDDSVPTGDTDPIGVSCPDDASIALASEDGCILGVQTTRGEAFWGIPYAQPPVGDLRWRRPQPVVPRDGVLTADDPGPPCPQSNGTITGDLAAGEGDEDCLRLQVMRPADAADLPIVFFVHGGSHADGSGSQPTFVDDPLLADEVVLVTHNYRLGPLGWLAHPELSEAEPDGVSGNQGLWDSLAALRWVHRHASRLGGDPDRILIVGESAGSISVCALWMSPLTRDLIAGAIGQSGPCSALRRPLSGGLFLESGEEQGERVLEALACHEADDPIACARDATVDDLLATAPGRQGPLGDGEDWGPVVDGVLLPQTAALAAATGDLPEQVSLVLTANAEEASIFTEAIPVPDDATYRALLAPYALIARTTVDALYDAWDPAAFGGDHHAAFQAFFTDAGWICPMREWLGLAGRSSTVHALFWERALYGEEVFGPFHGAELPYVFGTLAESARAPDRTLSDQVRATWQSLAGLQPTDPMGRPWPEIEDGWLHVRPDTSWGTLADVHGDRCDVLQP